MIISRHRSTKRQRSHIISRSHPSHSSSIQRNWKRPYVVHSQPPMMQSILLYHFGESLPASLGLLYHYPVSVVIAVLAPLILWFSAAKIACIHDRYMEFEQSSGGTFSPVEATVPLPGCCQSIPPTKVTAFDPGRHAFGRLWDTKSLDGLPTRPAAG